MFTSEVIGLYFVPNYSPDIEGIFFLTADGGVSRIGEDEAASPTPSDYQMLGARLIGFETRFASPRSNYPTEAIMELGIITDTTSCEELVFTDPNPFSNMVADIGTGTMVSQTQTIGSDTAWGYCGYTTTVLPSETWLTYSSPSNH